MRKVIKTYANTVVMARNEKRQRGLDHSMPITGTRGRANEVTQIKPGFLKRGPRVTKGRYKGRRGGALTSYLAPQMNPDLEAMTMAAALARLFSRKPR